MFEPFRHHAFAQPFSLEIDRGTVVGTYGAVVTPGGTLDFQTSDYFGLRSWREHPIFLRNRLPKIEDVDGTVVVLATRATDASDETARALHQRLLSGLRFA